MSLDRTWKDYDNDPQFRALVDMMTQMLMDLQTTPAELRQAVICAAIRLEMMKPPPAFIQYSDGRIEQVIVQEIKKRR